jgi:hypothetical protein
MDSTDHDPDDAVPTRLVDVTGMSLNDLRNCDDPALLAGVQRILDQVSTDDPGEGCC